MSKKERIHVFDKVGDKLIQVSSPPKPDAVGDIVDPFAFEVTAYNRGFKDGRQGADELAKALEEIVGFGRMKENYTMEAQMFDIAKNALAAYRQGVAKP